MPTPENNGVFFATELFAVCGLEKVTKLRLEALKVSSSLIYSTKGFSRCSSLQKNYEDLESANFAIRIVVIDYKCKDLK